MNSTSKANTIVSQITTPTAKLGDLRKIAKDIKVDHGLALELWSKEHFFARMLAILIMDKKLLNEDVINSLVNDMYEHEETEKLQLIDWLFANQLVKDKRWIELILRWENSDFSLQRRTFWYYQGRLRWMGKIQPDSDALLTKIEEKITIEQPEVQWAMNFLAGWIGVFEKKYRNRCLSLREKNRSLQRQNGIKRLYT